MTKKKAAPEYSAEILLSEIGGNQKTIRLPNIGSTKEAFTIAKKLADRKNLEIASFSVTTHFPEANKKPPATQNYIAGNYVKTVDELITFLKKKRVSIKASSDGPSSLDNNALDQIRETINVARETKKEGPNKLFYSDQEEKKEGFFWAKVPKGYSVFNPETGEVLGSTTQKSTPTKFRLKNIITREHRKAPAPAL